MDHLLDYFDSKSLWPHKESDWLNLSAAELWGNEEECTTFAEHHDNLTYAKHRDLLQGNVARAKDHSDINERHLSYFVVASMPASDNASNMQSKQEASLKLDQPKPAQHPPPIFSRIVDDLHLRSAYRFAMSSVAGVTALPPNPEIPDIQTYALVYHPKIAVIWSSSKTGAGPTNAIILARQDERKDLKEILETQWHPSIAAHALFPGFICALVLIQAVDTAHDTLKVEIRRIEARTKFHAFQTRNEEAAEESYEDLGAKVSGHSTKLASTRRKIRVAQEVQAFILEHAADRGDGGVGGDLMKGYARFLDERLKMQRLDNDYVIERAKVQQMATLHLITRIDTRIGLQVSKTTMDDSASMKALALAALMFLPGNFIAALFSTDLFKWDDTDKSRGVGVGVKPQFWLFWAITVPLTLLMFGLHACWWFRRKGQWESAISDVTEPLGGSGVSKQADDEL